MLYVTIWIKKQNGGFKKKPHTHTKRYYDMYAMNECFNLYNNKERYESNEIILLKNERCNRWKSELMHVHTDTYTYGIFN